MVMLYRCRVPRAPLDRFVDYIWVYRHDSRPRELERVLPTGTAQLIVNLTEDQTRHYDPDRGYRCITSSGTVLAGTRSRYQIIDTAEQDHAAGVVFKPEGIRAFIRVPAHETADGDVPLEAFWGRRDAALLRERVLESETTDAALDGFEAALLEKWTHTHPHPAVRFAVGTFDRAPHLTSVTEVTNAIGLSPKRFIERFKAEVGVTPKRYCRIRRFQRALTQIHRGESIDWAKVAIDGGYFDQAHFIHDFRSFTGLTPTQYQAGRTRFPNHVKFLQDDGRRVPAPSSHDE